VLAFTHPCRSQIGATKDELVQRYGPCSPNRAPIPTRPSVYDSVLDAGDLCTFHHDHLRITAFLKAGKAAALHYRKLETFSYGKRPHYLELSDNEISSILHGAVNADWIVVSKDTPVRRWRTSDSSAFAYCFPYKHSDSYALWVQTAAVDSIYQKAEGD
jgi:hypothetical protein